MRILLIQPASKSSELDFPVVAMTEPLALEAIAAKVPDHEVRILDMRFNPVLGEPILGNRQGNGGIKQWLQY